MVLAFLVLVIARTAPQSGAACAAAGFGCVAIGRGRSRRGYRAADHGPAHAVGRGLRCPERSRVGPHHRHRRPRPRRRHHRARPRRERDAAARVQPDPAAATTYKVRSGDTLSAIATRFDTTVKKIKVANGLTSNTLRIGQVLVIP